MPDVRYSFDLTSRLNDWWRGNIMTIERIVQFAVLVVAVAFFAVALL